MSEQKRSDQQQQHQQDQAPGEKDTASSGSVEQGAETTELPSPQPAATDSPTEGQGTGARAGEYS